MFSAVQGSFNRFPNITGMAPNLTQVVSSIDFSSQPGYWSNNISADFWAAVVSGNTLPRQTHAHRTLSLGTIDATQADLSYKLLFLQQYVLPVSLALCTACTLVILPMLWQCCLIACRRACPGRLRSAPMRRQQLFGTVVLCLSERILHWLGSSGPTTACLCIHVCWAWQWLMRLPLVHSLQHMLFCSKRH